jgi:hypothetical protein
MKIRPVGFELVYADRRTGRHDEAGSRFFRNFTNSPINSLPYPTHLQKRNLKGPMGIVRYLPI